MTVNEHALLGGTLALACGSQRRQGWAIVGMATIAAVLPDLDGLSLLFGSAAFAAVHRVWGHNLLVATVLGVLAGVSGYLGSLSVRVQQKAASVLARVASDLTIAPPCARPLSLHDGTVWLVVGSLAALSHLPIDIIFNGSAELAPWPVPLLWPFSNRGWQVPIVPWGDMGATVILTAELFLLYRWPARAQVIAVMTLAVLLGYVAVHWAVIGPAHD